jgi:hypothetical protein
MTNFRHNHYVPRWYQERFLPAKRKQRELFYLHKEPRTVRDGRGRRRTLPDVERRTLRNCFAQRDLYTLTFRGIPSTEFERNFFGEVDQKGRKAVAFWADFDHTTIDPDAFTTILTYLSTQRLRTPKGLDWLAGRIGSRDPLVTLAGLARFRMLFNALWAECVWQISDATASGTKFIVSDHPVTVYNRAYPPAHPQCRGSRDPDVHLNGTHTIFPLSLEKVLILTNRSWATNPYGSPAKERPNPLYERDAIFDFTDVQVGRQLDEQEVREINFIIKSRAYRFVAAAEKDWLYPEQHVPKKVKWSKLGGGYLLYPDPRSLHYGGETIIGYADGSTLSRDAYGRTLLDPDYGKDGFPTDGSDPLARLKGEFAQRYGRKRRGRGWNENEEDSEALHEYHLSQLKRRTKKEPQANASEQGGCSEGRQAPKAPEALEAHSSSTFLIPPRPGGTQRLPIRRNVNSREATALEPRGLRTGKFRPSLSGPSAARRSPGNRESAFRVDWGLNPSYTRWDGWKPTNALPPSGPAMNVCGTALGPKANPPASRVN